jgi:hypothetical protein
VSVVQTETVTKKCLIINLMLIQLTQSIIVVLKLFYFDSISSFQSNKRLNYLKDENAITFLCQQKPNDRLRFLKWNFKLGFFQSP